ncbi:MAG: GDSL-type esterase/lipase family protein [Planctomycetaceae bacterium]
MQNSLHFRALQLLAIPLTLCLTLAAAPLDEKSAPAKKSPERWEPDVQKLEQAFAKRSPPTSDVVFIGSSSIRRWKIHQSFPALNAVNHGFGGSQLADSVHFFERLVTPAKPHTIVLYAGDNDLNAGKSPETVLHDFQLFVDKAQTLPGCRKVVFLGIKPSIKRWAIRDKAIKANQLVSELCKTHPLAIFVDTWPAGLNAAGEPSKDLLADDDLHLNDNGYKIWTRLLQTALDSSP